MRRPILLTTIAITFGLGGSAHAQTPPPPPEERIRAGVTVGGVDVGNLTPAEAEAKLAATLGPIFAQDVTMIAGGKRFVLKPAATKLTFDAKGSAAKALAAGRAAPAAPDGTLPPASAAPSVSFERKPLWRFVRASKAGRAPRNARFSVRVDQIKKIPGRKGSKIAVKDAVAKLQATLADPAQPREITAKLVAVRPRVTVKRLRRQNPTIITVDRGSFRLRLFKQLRRVKTYRIATGLPGYTTPAGNFKIQTKQVNPTWNAPNSPWAGELAGQAIPAGDPRNPLAARWIGIEGPIGIHGTTANYSIGTRASRGCIRLTVPEVIDLFDRISIGTPIMIR